jgi:hypothetical protein
MVAALEGGFEEHTTMSKLLSQFLLWVGAFIMAAAFFATVGVFVGIGATVALNVVDFLRPPKFEIRNDNQR